MPSTTSCGTPGYWAVVLLNVPVLAKKLRRRRNIQRIRAKLDLRRKELEAAVEAGE